MHLWPSVRIRASFEDAYLRHLDWNLRRMRFHTSQEATAAAASGDDQGCEPLLSNKHSDLPSCCSVDLLRDALLLLSCCCCGDLDSEDEGPVRLKLTQLNLARPRKGRQSERMARHPVAEANERSPLGDLTPEEFYSRHGVVHATSTYRDPRGLNIFNQSWVPLAGDPAGILCVVHGFTGESSWLLQLTSVFFAEHGRFAVCALDHQGHGFSDGLQAHIPDINPVVDDCLAVFDAFRARFPPSLPCFLYSESLGGAIALLIHLRTRDQETAPGGRRWDGAILNGAMCAVSDKFKPPWPLEHLLWLAATVTPTWQVIPTRGTIPGVSFKVDWKRKLAVASPRRPLGRPRAATALELLRVCRELQGRFEEVTMPLLIVHGAEDRVCDPAGVEELYRRAGSEDKTLRVYEGMWHQIVGEPEVNVELAFGEMLEWLRVRAEGRARAHDEP